MKNSDRAIATAKIVTYRNGVRIVKKYESGEPLQGNLEQNDAPPFTGYVRGYGRKKDVTQR